MKLIHEEIALYELREMAKKMDRDIVKAVVDIDRELMAVDASLDVDLEQFLLDDHASEQDALWGINFHPTEFGTDRFVEFDSMINVRPLQGNRSRGVENAQVREKIKKIAQNLVKND